MQRFSEVESCSSLDTYKGSHWRDCSCQTVVLKISVWLGFLLCSFSYCAPMEFFTFVMPLLLHWKLTATNNTRTTDFKCRLLSFDPFPIAFFLCVCVCVCVCACVHACVRASVRACVRVCVRERERERETETETETETERQRERNSSVRILYKVFILFLRFMYIFFIFDKILWSMVCSPLSVRYYATEITSIIIIINR